MRFILNPITRSFICVAASVRIQEGHVFNGLFNRSLGQCLLALLQPSCKMYNIIENWNTKQQVQPDSKCAQVERETVSLYLALPPFMSECMCGSTRCVLYSRTLVKLNRVCVRTHGTHTHAIYRRDIGVFEYTGMRDMDDMLLMMMMMIGSKVPCLANGRHLKATPFPQVFGICYSQYQLRLNLLYTSR